jgi:glycosyltransferase involved in cell wall biosynthesis
MDKYNYDLSLVVACYNEEPHLRPSVKQIEQTLKNTLYEYELIFIDDYSQDGTRKEIEEICRGKENYRYYFHEKNVGRGGTVREGLLLAEGKYAGFLDIDLEVSPIYIPSMINALEKGYDCAIGYRFYDLTQASGFLRAVLSLGYRLLTRYLLKITIRDTETGYKFFNMAKTKNIIEQTANTKWFWDTEIICGRIKADKLIWEVPCLFIRNKEKKSTVRLIPDIIDYLKAILKYKYKIIKK